MKGLSHAAKLWDRLADLPVSLLGPFFAKELRVASRRRIF